jgi:hypothetical protein
MRGEVTKYDARYTQAKGLDNASRRTPGKHDDTRATDRRSKGSPIGQRALPPSNSAIVPRRRPLTRKRPSNETAHASRS